MDKQNAIGRRAEAFSYLLRYKLALVPDKRVADSLSKFATKVSYFVGPGLHGGRSR